MTESEAKWPLDLDSVRTNIVQSEVVMQTKTVLVILLLLGTLGLAKDWPAMREEADRGLPPRIQYYNRLKGEPRLGPFDQHLSEPESLNVRLVGKWGRGPAASVTGRDTLVYLALGSEVAVFNCVNAHNPRIVNEIQCRYVVDRVILKDSLLYAVLQGGVEVFNVANPASVTRIKYLPISVVDMCIADTMAYTIDADSFKAYRIVAPDSFQRLGACADSGYYIAADSSFAYLCDRWGLYVIDATDPMNPHQATILTGAQTGAVLIDSGYCYYTTASASPNSFRIADVSDPYLPIEVGYINGIASYDLFKLSYFVYLPGYYIVDVSTPSFPSVVGSYTPGGLGVWTRSPFSSSFLAASWDGLRVLDITDPVHPSLDTLVPGADVAKDVYANGNRAYVADQLAGTKILNVTNPAVPNQVGEYDTADFGAGINGARADAVSARDTLAYLLTEMWAPFNLRVLDVSSPESPTLLGGRLTWNPGVAIEVRDSLAYVAEDGKLEIFSIANPRNPRLVGSCGLVNGGGGLSLQDTFAYVASDLNIVNIADPAHPWVVSRTPSNCWSVAVQDTFAYLSHAYESLCVFSVADPLSPREVGWARLNGQGYDVVVSGNRAYVGCYDFRVFDISDPAHPVLTGQYATPDRVRGVFYDGRYVYAACRAAGVCIFDTASTAVVESTRDLNRRAEPQISCWPSPAKGCVEVLLEADGCKSGVLSLYDLTGRRLTARRVPVSDGGRTRFDLTGVRPGLYFLTWRSRAGAARVKLVVG